MMDTTIVDTSGKRGPIPLKIKTWLQDVYKQCPSWEKRWVRFILELETSGKASYRGYSVFLKDNTLHMKGKGGLHHTFFGHLNSQINKEDLYDKIFLHCHNDIATLLEAAPLVLENSQVQYKQMEKLLLLCWPVDPFWEKAVLSFLNEKEAGLTKSNREQPQFLPRLLSERRQGLILSKEMDTWATQKGASLPLVLGRSNQKRRAMLEAMTNISSLTKIEIPFALDYEKVLEVVTQIGQVLNGDHKLVKKARKEKRTWRLAFRRIQGMGFCGCFDVATQTIIVDPRHIESMKHEFCHWLLGHKITIEKDSAKLRKAEEEVHVLEKELFNLKKG